MLPRQTVPAGPVVLRPPTGADAGPIARACADPLTARFLPAVPVPYTSGDALDHLRDAERAWESGGASFAVADAATGAWLGGADLTPPDARGNAEIGFLIAPWARGRGVATAAVRALTGWAFAHGVRWVEALADVENLPGQRVALSAGLRHEGVRRSAQEQRDGGRGDLVAFTRLPGDPDEPVRPFLPAFPGGSLSDGPVRLTPLTGADTGDYHALHSLPDVVRHSFPSEVPDPAESARRCREAGTRWLAGERAEIGVRDAATGAFAGHIQLTAIIPLLGEAMTGYSTLPEFRGRGFTARAVSLLVAWAFEHTALARIVAGTSPGNVASHRVLQRAGFTREGLQHGLLPGPDGSRLDDLRWYRLRPRA